MHQRETAAVSIVRPSRGGASVPQGLEYSQSLNERNTFYFNRSTAGPSSGPSDPKMMPTVLELPPPSLEATSMASSSRFAQYSASAPAAPTIGSWRTDHTMKPSPEDAEPAKIAHDGTPTIFSFLTTPAGPEAGLASTDERLEASFETFSLQPGGAGEGGTKHDEDETRLSSDAARRSGSREVDDGMFELDD